jgi:hypothetical protein
MFFPLQMSRRLPTSEIGGNPFFPQKIEGERQCKFLPK